MLKASRHQTHLYDLSVEIESPVFHVTEQLFMFFTSRDIIERRTRGLEDFSMFETIRENAASTIGVSIPGSAKTAMKRNVMPVSD